MPPPKMNEEAGMLGGEMPPVPEPGTTERAAAEDMVLIQLPRAQLQTVIDSFRQITSLLESAAGKADTDIAAQTGSERPLPGTMKPEPTESDALASEIEGMRRSRGM